MGRLRCRLTCPPSGRLSSRSLPDIRMRKGAPETMTAETITDNKLAHPELAAFEVHGITRASFMLRGALAAGAVYGTSAVAPFVSQALAQSGGGDAEILNFALTLEYLETAFYTVKGKQVGLSGQAKAYAKQFGMEEEQH